MTTKLDEIWERLQPTTEPLYSRVDDTHPLDIYLGREVTGERLLVLLTDAAPPQFPNGQSINVVILQRNDGRWSLVFRLNRSELSKIFSQLCDDLVESSRGCLEESSGATFILARFLRWKKLLERGLSSILDESRLRGLVGEMLFLLELIPVYGASESLQAWLGPFGADQDFRCEDRWYEVKTVRPGAQSVQISSVEQLDLPDYPGELVLIYLDNAGYNEPNSFNPLDLANQIREIVSSDINALELFDSILEGFGFSLIDEYRQFNFVLRSIRRFEVEDTFPLIRRAGLHSGIGNIKYDIELSSLSSYERCMLEEH